jgi:type I restriction enzyme S subunit
MNAEQLLQHFERISEAPDAIPRLRRFILDLAVRGKLVEQEPPEKLVEAARAEVARSNGAREYQAFITGLRSRAKVEIDKAQLEAKTP